MKINIAARRKARRLILQALYQLLFTGDELSEIQKQFESKQSIQTYDHEYFCELLHKIPAHITELDELLKQCIDRKLSDLTPVELTVLRIGAFELSKRPEIPYKVVINEALELNKTYGAAEGYKYVNAVLDKLAVTLRPDECQNSK